MSMFYFARNKLYVLRQCREEGIASTPPHALANDDDHGPGGNNGGGIPGFISASGAFAF